MTCLHDILLEYRFCNRNSILFRHSSVGYEQYNTLSSKAYLTSCITRGSQFVRCSLQEFKASREIAGDLCPIYKLAFLPRKGGEEKEAIHPIKRCQIGRTERLRILIPPPPIPSRLGRRRLLYSPPPLADGGGVFPQHSAIFLPRRRLMCGATQICNAGPGAKFYRRRTRLVSPPDLHGKG